MGTIYFGTRRIMLVQDLFLPLLQQSKELQWFKVFLSPSNLAITSVGIVVVKVGIQSVSPV